MSRPDHSIVILKTRRRSNYSNNGRSGTHGGKRDEKNHIDIGWEGRKERGRLEDLGHRWNDQIKTHRKASNEITVCELEGMRKN
jgi:hypothetical protein